MEKMPPYDEATQALIDGRLLKVLYQTLWLWKDLAEAGFCT